MQRLILASESSSRRAMLINAGVSFEAIPAYIDEESIKESILAEGGKPKDVADILAEMKAISLSRQHPEAYVLGSDQVLVLENNLMSKAANRSEAKAHLLSMSGKTHSLIAAAVIAKNGQAVWRGMERAKLTMRTLSEGDVDRYLEDVGDNILSSVGCYHIEGKGAQLFDQVKGDFFTILGLPLFKVLAQLRLYGMMV